MFCFGQAIAWPISRRCVWITACIQEGIAVDAASEWLAVPLASAVQVPVGVAAPELTPDALLRACKRVAH